MTRRYAFTAVVVAFVVGVALNPNMRSAMMRGHDAGEATDPQALRDVDQPGTVNDVEPSGASIGLDLVTDPSSEPEGVLRTPSGRLITPGTIDDKGYVLPLDIRRPRPARDLPARPTATEIAGLRSSARPGLFTEVRLGPDNGHTQNETSIDADGQTVVAGFHNFTGSGLELAYASSTDGGASWIEGLIQEHGLMSNPVIKTGGNGNWYYCYLAEPGAGGNDIDIYVRRSTNSGQTWGAAVAASANTVFDDKPYMDARGDEVLVAWADFGAFPRKITVAISVDGAQTFGPNAFVSPSSEGGNGACPVIDDLGNYFVFWRDSFQESLWVTRSTDGGTSWSVDRGIVGMDPLPTPQPGGYRLVNLPSADAQPLTGTLVVVWNDERFGDGDILSIRSTDGGSTWSAPVRVNDDVSGETQFFPWIDFDAGGVAHVVWYDRRANGFDIDVYVSKSLDGGQTWEPNVRVTAAPFTPILPSEGGAAAFIGDYNGIAATATTVYPLYQDSREGNQDVYVALIPSGTSGVAEDGALSTPTRPATIVASPTPFRGSVSLEVRGTAREVEIIGVDGRRVRRLEVTSGVVAWDGRDGEGRIVSRGVYFARVPGVSGSAVRVVKLD